MILIDNAYHEDVWLVAKIPVSAYKSYDISIHILVSTNAQKWYATGCMAKKRPRKDIFF